MIQELLRGNNVSLIGGGDQRSKLSSTPSCGSILDGSNPPATATANANANATGASENLRCPRCDSSNTKFCYYNNYNLTQPRHFCKTCRRYWTKGGALRNVPIGGGCRKNKSVTVATPVGKSSSVGKSKTVSCEMAKAGLFNEGFSTNPILWASSQNSHLLSHMRSNPNPSHLSNPVKDEGPVFGSYQTSESAIFSGGTSARALGLEPLSPIQLPSFGLTSSFFRNQAQAGQGVILGEVQNNGLQELYQRLRSPTSCYPDHAPVILGNVANSAASNSAILDSAPVATGEMGFWNSTLSWPADLPTTNGAYP